MVNTLGEERARDLRRAEESAFPEGWGVLGGDPTIARRECDVRRRLAFLRTGTAPPVVATGSGGGDTNQTTASQAQ
jgi:hypothetical protein